MLAALAGPSAAQHARRSLDIERGSLEARRPLETEPAGTASGAQGDQVREVAVEMPLQCGGYEMDGLRQRLERIESPDAPFYVELWSDKQEYQLLDPVYYYLYSNQPVYVTLFWIGPDKGVFMPFMNVRLDANRNHRLDPSNVVVEPTGTETWRVIATPEPQRFPCTGSEEDFLVELDRVQRGAHSAARWQVLSSAR
jgi:hypothetical protein